MDLTDLLLLYSDNNKITNKFISIFRFLRVFQFLFLVFDLFEKFFIFFLPSLLFLKVAVDNFLLFSFKMINSAGKGFRDGDPLLLTFSTFLLFGRHSMYFGQDIVPLILTSFQKSFKFDAIFSLILVLKFKLLQFIYFIPHVILVRFNFINLDSQFFILSFHGLKVIFLFF